MTIERPTVPPGAEPTSAMKEREAERWGGRSGKPAAEGLSRRAALAGLAVLPAGLPAVAATEPDPIFGVIERNREISEQHDAAVFISAKLDSGPAFDAADEISQEKRLALAEHTNVLILSKPTTVAGVVALSRYVASLPAWQVSDDEDWHKVLLGTLADAIDEISTSLPPAY